MFDGEQFVAVVAAHAQCAIAGEVARGFEQADGVHQVFRVVALAVRLGAGVARRVAFARSLDGEREHDDEYVRNAVMLFIV